MLFRFLKDPQAILDYYWDWADWLKPGETIVSLTVQLVGGLTLALGKPAPAIVVGVTSEGLLVPNAAVCAWLADGTLDVEALATCHITTSAGREDDRTFKLHIVER
jgi:hypothetical protein